MPSGRTYSPRFRRLTLDFDVEDVAEMEEEASRLGISKCRLVQLVWWVAGAEVRALPVLDGDDGRRRRNGTKAVWRGLKLPRPWVSGPRRPDRPTGCPKTDR